MASHRKPCVLPLFPALPQSWGPNPPSPLLSDLQHRALLEVVSAGPALQGGEGHVATAQWGDVTELRGAEGHPLIIARAQVLTLGPAVGLLAGGTVVLVGLPWAAGTCALVDSKALRAAGVELQPHVGDLISFPCSRKAGTHFTAGKGGSESWRRDSGRAASCKLSWVGG